VPKTRQVSPSENQILNYIQSAQQKTTSFVYDPKPSSSVTPNKSFISQKPPKVPISMTSAVEKPHI
jgi:hypothetical protein